MWGKKTAPNYFSNNFVKPPILISLVHVYFNKFPITRVFTFCLKWKTRNQLKIHLVHLLADENEYIDDSFVLS